MNGIISGLLRWCVALSLGLLIAGIVFSHALILPGLLLLIATPILRVIVSVVAFTLEKEWAFVGITTVVLLLLFLSFTLGK